ncbi:MAG TPA: hypothetical protein VKC66_07735, partial [Xanthobacteraceae bacterium]|nr:hypothetical protein [Xanthobacteraceae bacterium]
SQLFNTSAARRNKTIAVVTAKNQLSPESWPRCWPAALVEHAAMPKARRAKSEQIRKFGNGKLDQRDSSQVRILEPRYTLENNIAASCLRAGLQP